MGAMGKALAATAAAAAVGVALYLKAGAEDDGVEELPACSRDEVVAMLTKLVAIMNQNVQALMRKINAQNAQIPQQLLQQYLVEHFETQLKEVQQVVFSEQGYDVEDVEAACAYYEAPATRDEGVADACNQLRQLYINVGGSVDLDLPEDLTVERMCDVFGEYMRAVVAAQAAFAQHLQQLKARGAQVTSQDLNETRQATMQEKVSVVLKKYGLSNLVFQAAIEKYNDHPLFQAKIAEVKSRGEAAKAGQLPAAAAGR